MNFNFLKEEYEKYIKNNNKKFDDNFFNLLIYRFLKESNYNTLYKKLSLFINSNKYSLEYKGSIGLQYSEEEFKNTHSSKSISILNKNDIEILKDLIKIENINNLNEFENFIKKTTIFNEDSNTFDNFLKKFSFSNLEEGLFSIIKLSIERNKTLKNYFLEEPQDYLYTICQTSNNYNDLSRLIIAYYENTLFQNENNNSYSSRNSLINNVFFDTRHDSINKLSTEDFNFLCSKDKYLSLLAQNKTLEDFILNSFNLLLEDIKSIYIPSLKLKLKRTIPLEDILSECDDFMNNLKKNHSYLFDENYEINENISKDNHLELQNEIIRSLIDRVEYNLFKSNIVNDGLKFNYSTNLFKVLEIISDLNNINDLKFISLSNCLYLQDEELLKKSLNKFFDHCSINKIIISEYYSLPSKDPYLKNIIDDVLSKRNDIIYLKSDNFSNEIINLAKDENKKITYNQLLDIYNKNENNKLSVNLNKSKI